MSKLFLHRCEEKNKEGEIKKLEAELVKKSFSLIELLKPEVLIKPFIEKCNEEIPNFNTIDWSDIVYATEVADEHGIIDILIKTKNCVIGIEAKLNAGEGNNQVLRYVNKLLKFNEPNKLLLLLTKKNIETIKIETTSIPIRKLKWKDLADIAFVLQSNSNDYATKKAGETLYELLADFGFGKVTYDLTKIRNRNIFQICESYNYFIEKPEVIKQKGRRYWKKFKKGDVSTSCITQNEQERLNKLCEEIYPLVEDKSEPYHKTDYNSFLFHEITNDISYVGRYYKYNMDFLFSRSVVFDPMINQILVLLTIEKEIDRYYPDNRALYETYKFMRDKKQPTVFQLPIPGSKNRYKGIAKIIEFEKYDLLHLPECLESLYKKLYEDDEKF